MRVRIFQQNHVYYLFLLPVLFSVLSGSDSPESHLTICILQGRESEARYEGLPVRTEGVVTLDLDDTGAKGFFMQDADCDGDPFTSDGIFVYLGERADVVSPGDRVVVRGWVNEYQGLTEIGTEPHHVDVVGLAPQPEPVPFDPPWERDEADAYFEAHESMRIAIDAAGVVGPTTTRGDAYVVSSNRYGGRVMHGAHGGSIVRVGGEGLYQVAPEVKVGDRVLGLEGVLAVHETEFVLQLTSPAEVIANTLEFEPLPPPAADISFATLNLHNLFDTFNDPATRDQVPSAAAYRRKLEKLARTIAGDLRLPLFIAVQEAENDDVLQALANRPELPVRYDFVWANGPDPRGIDVGLLYRTDRVEILGWESRQGCTGLMDGLGPDGNLDPVSPKNDTTCDRDGLPGFEGNRLFSRPPLVIRLAVCETTCAQDIGRSIYTIVSFHLKSKSQDTSDRAYTEPRRIEQAAFLATIYADLLSVDPDARVVFAGDFNDYPVSEAAHQLSAAGLINLMTGRRYTYNFGGVSQVLDQVFVSPAAHREAGIFLAAFPRHMAADFPVGLENDSAVSLRASDHDPVLVFPVPVFQMLHFPLIVHP